MTARHALFEISWEVCNKLGGIHTVLSSKAVTAVQAFGDDYVTVGPWLLSDTDRDVPFDEDPSMADFADTCRAMGVPVRVGRWRIPGRPRCVLVEFSGLIDQKDAILAKLWDEFRVDSLQGGWDYVEPVLFGEAAGRVVAAWHARFLAPRRRSTVAQAHEWMTASALLHLKAAAPAVGTVFTIHSTALGRELASHGRAAEIEAARTPPLELARELGVIAKHSIEDAAARESDVFTTVSPVTAREAAKLHGREPDGVVPNGIDLEVVDALAGSAADRTAARAAIENLARRFLGTPDLRNAALLCVSGRYEFHNKGFDVLLDALGRVDRTEGRPLVLFVMVPAGNSGIRREVRGRLDGPAPTAITDPIGITTHHLFDEEKDPIRVRCAALGLTNQSGARVKVIHVPVYVGARDGLIEREYETVLAAMDLGVFPSFYEPWGYTPQEAVALGVPTITSDHAGFGQWALDAGLTVADGVDVLRRAGRDDAAVVADLAASIEAFLARPADEVAAIRQRCRQAAARTAWSDLFAAYQESYGKALEACCERHGPMPLPQTLPPPVTIRATGGQAPNLSYFDVAATLPHALRPLERIARNFWWCWDPEAPDLFRDISPDAWQRCHHNPVRFLKQAWAEDLDARAADRRYIARLERVASRFDAYMKLRRDRLPIDAARPDAAAFSAEHPIAYFCAEFGLHESLPIYSGGLGILAGDHVKSASDLNLPFVGVGLFYRYGYMAQKLTADGQQIAVDIENSPEDLAIEPVRRADGSQVEVKVPLPGRDVTLRAWQVPVGRTTVYLLDANCPSNRDEDRDLTRNLYGGDSEMRIKQLIALGRGGVRLLAELGIRPAVYHMNEGHAAFLSLERVGRLVRSEGYRFEEAREVVRATTAFTTHTPVPAGHDRFPEDMMRRYFSDVPDWVGVPWERFLELGRADRGAHDFNMTYLALSFASYVNGVSALHGIASRQLLHPYWPSLIEEEVPVRHVTNGIHLPTWVHPKIGEAVGIEGGRIAGTDFATRSNQADRRRLWEIRRQLKLDLKRALEQRIRDSFVERSDSPLVMNRTLAGIDPDALWIGFARRFAPYKRAGLIYKDIARLQRILDDADRPVRLFVAGKAHPRDGHGQDILRGIAGLARGDQLIGRVIFVEDYDIDLARSLVQGVDVWLNNPTRMQEASGTSGMKVAANGGLNLSIADGWWPEIADGHNGWTIGELRRSYDDQELQDQLDATTLYRILEEDVVPRYFERDAEGVPQSWMDMVVHNLATVPPFFNTDRMVQQYYDDAYRDLGRDYFAMRDDRSRAQRIAEFAQRIRKGFENIRVLELRQTELGGLRVGDPIDAWVRLDLDGLKPDEVTVELILGHATRNVPDSLQKTARVRLEPVGTPDGTVHTFAATHRIERSGSYAAGLRIRPRRQSSSPSSLRELVRWV